MPESTVETYVTDAPDKVVSVPSVTASLYVCAPVVMTEPPLNCVVPLASVVTDPKPASWDKLSRASLPMAPPKTVAPACVLIVREKSLPSAPSTVDANVTSPIPSSSITTSAVSSTASLKVAEEPFRLMSAPISVRPSAFVISEARRSVPPTAPPKIVAPACVLTVKENWLPPALSTVEANVTLPGPLSSITTSAVSSTGSLNVAEAPFRWMSAAISVVPSALVVSVPKRPVPPTTPPNTVAPPPLVLTVSEAQARP